MWFVMLACCLLALPSLAESDTQSQLLAIDSAFVTGQYPQVELLTLRLLQSNAALTPQERSRVNLTAGYTLIMQGRESEARIYFERALDAEPNLVLDPVQVSPKFRVVFDEVKAGHQLAKPQTEPFSSLRPTGPSRHALLSNLLIPGSGQWREGHRLRGGIFLVAQVTSIAFLINQMNRARDSHEEYLAQTQPQRIADAYDTYNRDYGLVWGAGALAGVVYLAAQMDLILYRETEKHVAVSPVFGRTPGLALRATW